MKSPSLLRLGLVGASLLYASHLWSQDVPVIRGAESIGEPVTPIAVEVDIKSLPQVEPWKPGDPIREFPLHAPKNINRPPREPRPVGLDPLVDRQLEARENRGSTDPDFETLLVNREGIDFTGANPSDTIGDVGIDYYIQMTNAGGGSQVLIIDKETGATEAQFALASLAAGSGTNCAATFSDPIVMYDQNAFPNEGRWFLAEFTNNSLCMFVSQTTDPTAGTWFVYEFFSDTNGVPDYHKYGIWPDAYYVGANEPAGTAREYAFDRTNMLLGQTARPLQVFVSPDLPGFGFQHIMPVDWDGPMPPANGAPGLFMRHRDTEIHGPAGMPTEDIIELFEFSVDFDNAANSSLTGPTNIMTSEFDSEFCNLVFSGCLTQPGSATTLFALLQPIMWRAQYRNFGAFESIVFNLTTDVNGNDIAGVRWIELRNTGGGWTTFQEGTVTEADGISRWMGSVAQDEAGNIVAGYNVVGVASSGNPADNVFPGMRYSGRLAGDPAGTMPQGEVSIIEGTAPNNSIRYGDYSSLTVDPIDNCTFWYTAQHNQSGNWSTRIGSFRFNACGEPGFTLSAANTNQEVCVPGDLDDITINVGSISDFTNPVTLSLDSPPTGVSATFTPNPVTPDNMTLAQISADGTTPLGMNTINVLGTATGASDRTLFVTANVFDAVPSAPVLTAPADDAINVLFASTEFSWAASTQGGTYTLEVATDEAFTNIIFTTTTTDLSATVVGQLDSSTEYFWRVRSNNACGDSADSATFSFTTAPAPGDCPMGVQTNIIYQNDVEGGVAGFSVGGMSGAGGENWSITTTQSNSGTSSWFAPDIPEVTDQQLTTPAIDLPDMFELPITLSYFNRKGLEERAAGGCFDAGIIEISANGGAFTQLEGAVILTDPLTGTVDGGFMNPLAGLQGWCDTEPFVESLIDLSAFAGQSVRFRFRVGTDSSVGDDGWYIDDIEVRSCGMDPDVVFRDGFE